MLLLRVSLSLILAIGALTESTAFSRRFSSDLSQCPTFKTVPGLRHLLMEQDTCPTDIINADLNSCCELYNADDEPTSGIYSVMGRETFCDLNSSGGGWMLVQRSYAVASERKSGLFSKNWTTYERGFGDPNELFWLGLETLHSFTSQWSTTELRIDMFSSNGSLVHFAHYDHIVVGNKRSNYRLSVSGFNGTVPDYLSYHNGVSFSATDRDNDGQFLLDCARIFGAGWWYTRGCGPVYPYYYNNRAGRQVAVWGNYTVTGIEMKVRPKHWMCRST